MIGTKVEQTIHQLSFLEETGLKLARAIHAAVLEDESLRSVFDVLHGTWLGHPFHPVLTDVTIGAWSLAGLFDALSLVGGGRQAERSADALIAIGSASAVPTAVAGVADYSTIPKPATATGVVHALTNTVALILYLLSLRARRNGDRGRGIVWSSLALSAMTVSAWLGGELVYRHKVGVNHGDSPSKPKEWTAVLAETELSEDEPRRVDVAGTPVLLYRNDGEVYAIGAVCSHAGGPLEKGQFDGACVQCPWHDSVFDMRTGEVVHGPATYMQADYATRVRDGQIEVRLGRA